MGIHRAARFVLVALVSVIVAILGVGLALGLGPGVLQIPGVTGRPAIDERSFLVPPSTAKQEKQLGADTTSVVDTTPTARQTPLAMPTAAVGDQRFAVLLMGYGGGGHDGAYLTDSMMVVIVDPRQKTLTLLSVPRDSWVPLYFDGKTPVYNKINTAYAFAEDPTLYPDRLPRYSGAQGSGTFAMDSVSRLLGIPIRYYLSLDFQGFRDMINAVGGIEVDVPDSFAARYPINDNPSINAGWTVVRFTKGQQHMDGERAIEYARAREAIQNLSEGTDFARSRRQRLIMEAFKNRLFQPGGLIHLPQLLEIASKHIDTNYSIPDATQLAQLVLGWKHVRIYQTALTASNYLESSTGPDGTYVLVPFTPHHTWAQIRAFTRRLWQDPALGVAMSQTTIVVQNDSGVPGVALQISEALMHLGYNVGVPITGPQQERSRLIDETGGHAPLVLHALRHDLGINLRDGSAASADSSARVVLEIGATDANLRLSVPTDRSAPASVVGVVKFGVWPDVPTPPTPTPAPIIVPRARPTPPVRPTASEPMHATPTPALRASELVVVPSLIKLPAAVAQRLITADGLQSAPVNYQTLNDVPDHRYFLSIPPGAVLSQFPAPGLKVPRGTRVEVAVRKQ